jgi:hypothetical protein
MYIPVGTNQLCANPLAAVTGTLSLVKKTVILYAAIQVEIGDKSF